MIVVECDSVVLVPVTLTCMIPWLVKVHVSVEFPCPATLVGSRLQDVLLVVRLMLFENPLRLVRTIVALAGEPGTVVIELGPADMVKSWTM